MNNILKTSSELLNKVITWLTPQRLITVGLIVALSLGATYCAKSVDSWKHKYQTYYDSTRIVLAQNDSVKKAQAALQVVANRQSDEIARGRVAISSLHNENVKLRNSLAHINLDSLLAIDPTIISHSDTGCLKLRDAVVALRVLNDGLERENTLLAADTVKSNAHAKTLQDGWDNEKRESARLAAMLAQAPKPENDKLLGFIPLPSRTQSFLLGGAIGLVTAIVILK